MEIRLFSVFTIKTPLVLAALAPLGPEGTDKCTLNYNVDNKMSGIMFSISLGSTLSKILKQKATCKMV